MTQLIPISSAPNIARGFLKRFDLDKDKQISPKEASAVARICKKRNKNNKECAAAISFLNNYQRDPLNDFLQLALTHYDNALGLFAKGKIDESIIELKESLGTRPNFSSALILLSIAYTEKADIHERAGNKMAAIAMYEAAKKTALLFLTSVNVKFAKEGIDLIMVCNKNLERLNKK